MPEIWGECGVCQRWFYCERSVHGEKHEPHCPVCGERPIQVAPSPESSED